MPMHNLGGALVYLVWELGRPAYLVQAENRDAVEAALDVGAIPWRDQPSILRLADPDDPMLAAFGLNETSTTL